MNKPDPSSVTPRASADAPTYSADTSHLALPAQFDPQTGAKVWAEWVEAGRLWMSWWMNSLPTMPWPPAGMVVPPTPGGVLRADPAEPDNPATMGQANSHAAAQATKHVRSASARHH